MLDNFTKAFRITEKGLLDELSEKATITAHDKGDVLIRENEYIKVLKIVLKGRVRIFQEKEDRQVLIYYLRDMETCTLSLSACFQDCKSNVTAVVESKTTVLNIPVRYVRDWSFEYKSWHNFTVNTFTKSYAVLMSNYSQLAFNNLKTRILMYVNEKATEENNFTIQISHQRLADELGTTRVVVSRLLKQLEKDNFLNLGHRKIQIIK